MLDNSQGISIMTPAEKVVRGLTIFFVCVTAFEIASAKRTPQPPAQAITPAVEQVSQPVRMPCEHNLKCWSEKNWAVAAAFCQEKVERLALHDYKWDGGWLEKKFPLAVWSSESNGTLLYAGDNLAFQNGFGAWNHVKYYCEYDPYTQGVLRVGADEGRF